MSNKYFLAAIVESLEDSVVTVDFDAVITSWNKGAERVYGYRPEDVIGQPLTKLTLPEDMQDLFAKIERVRHGETVLTYETERIHKDGSRLVLSITLSPVKDANGRVIGVSTQAQAEGKEIKLISDYPADPLMVNADPVRVQQIVWNLVNNAVKFTPRDGRVSVRLSREADKAKLEVEDTGQGISPEFLPHIFEMFRQANGRITRAHGGLGIGLAQVKQLVDLHGGQIQAHSEGAGRGTRFTMWLPLHTTAPERPSEVTKSSEGEILVLLCHKILEFPRK